jgi:GTP-binding protein
LLHLVDLAPLDDQVDCAGQVRQLETELGRFDASLLDKPRWLIFTKADLLQPEEAQQKAAAIRAELDWQGEWALVSAVSRTGTRELMQRVSDALLELDELRETDTDDADVPRAENAAVEADAEGLKNNPE